MKDYKDCIKVKHRRRLPHIVRFGRLSFDKDGGINIQQFGYKDFGEAGLHAGQHVPLGIIEYLLINSLSNLLDEEDMEKFYEIVDKIESTEETK